MQYKKVQNRYILKLERGEEIIEALTDFVKENNLQSGSIQAIGAVSRVELGFYYLDKKEYSWKKFDKNLEISSLTGNIAYADDEIIIHAHGVFADEDNNCFGGHIKTATVSATCELTIDEFDSKLIRNFNDEIGLKLLNLENK